MAVKSIAILLFLCTLPAFGQEYPSTWLWSRTDHTSTATGGSSPVNAWMSVYPAGACPANTLAAAPNGNLYCPSPTDNFTYEYEGPTTGWVQLTLLGTSVKAIAAINDSTVYTLQSYSACNPWYTLYSGTSTSQSFVGSCWKTIQVSVDGTIAGVNSNSQLVYSTNGGVTVQFIDGGNTYSFVSIADQYSGCAVRNGQVYWISPNAGVSNLMTQPSYTVSQCAITRGEDPVLVILGTGGQQSILNTANPSWDNIGHSVNYASISTSGKGRVFALRSNGDVDYWNIRPPRLTLTMAGTWPNCPNAAHPCSNIQPAPTHTLTATVHATSGGLNSSVNTQTTQGNPSSNLQATAYDDFGQCSMEYGDVNDPACVPNANSGSNADCSVAGPLGGSDTPAPLKNILTSLYYNTATGNNTYQGGSYCSAWPCNTKYTYVVTMACGVKKSCQLGTNSTCAPANPTVYEYAEGNTQDAAKNAATWYCDAHEPPNGWRWSYKYIQNQAPQTCEYFNGPDSVLAQIPGPCN